MNYLWVFHCNLLNDIFKINYVSQTLKAIFAFRAHFWFWSLNILFLIKCWIWFATPFGFNNDVETFWFIGIFRFVSVIPQYYWYFVLLNNFWNHVKFTTVNLQINWYFKLMPNLKFIKPLLIHTYVLITLLGLIIGHSSSDNNKVRRRYDILDEALNSITVILPTKYLWFSDGRLGFKQSQREMKWTQNYPVLSVLYGRHLV